MKMYIPHFVFTISSEWKKEIITAQHWYSQNGLSCVTPEALYFFWRKYRTQT